LPRVDETGKSSDELQGLLTPETPELSALSLNEDKGVDPREALMSEAANHYYGHDGYLQDYHEAFKLYRDAARLGSPAAYRMLGDMYRHGQGVREDQHRALDCYKEGVKTGDYFSFIGMTHVFLSSSHMENAIKSFSMFIAGGEADSWKAKSILTKEFHMVWILMSAKDRTSQFLTAARTYLPRIKDSIIEQLNSDNAIKRPRVKQDLVVLLNTIEATIKSASS
jgi:hypothetical protein